MKEPTLGNPQNTIEVLQKYNFVFQKKFGQNFLIDTHVLDKIIGSAEITKDDVVLEIGPGIGTMTQYLACAAKKVIAVEIDKALIPILEDTLSEYENVRVINHDVLKVDIAKLAEEENGGKPIKVVANLPYYITSPVLTRLLESRCFSAVTVMVQKEVARRICAAPGTADYSAFSILCQYHAAPELLFDVPASCFIPQPKVTSSVIRLRRREKPPVEVGDEKLMFRVIRAAFNQRRKTLVNALSSQLGVLDKENAARVLVNCGFDTKIRGETVDIVGFAKISDEISSIIGADL